MIERKVIIGSRDSDLALIQSETVRDYIRENHPEIEAVILSMKTSGDKILDRALDKVGGKGLFVKELDMALSEGRSDLSVHSLKDMPMDIPEELPVIQYSRREDPRDVLILPEGAKELDPGKPIGTSSKRRILQLKTLYPYMQFESIRGNVRTRLRKLDSGKYSAIILAAAGIKRLHLEYRISRYFEISEVLPAPGQGILAVQGRRGEDYAYLDGYGDENTFYAALGERAFVRSLNGGCSSPVAAYAVVEDGDMVLEGLYYVENTGEYFREKIAGKKSDAEELGKALACRMKEL